MKYKIEKNTVQETLILPLYSRKLCTELYPNLYRDETAVRLLDQIDHCRAGVVFQVRPHLKGKVILPHGDLQRTKALHQAAGVFLCL